jgi:SLT domain-containing protein
MNTEISNLLLKFQKRNQRKETLILTKNNNISMNQRKNSIKLKKSKDKSILLNTKNICR